MGILLRKCNNKNTIHLFIDATVGFENTFYQVNEAAGTVEICAVVYEPDIDCPIQIDFNVTFKTEVETAGRYMHACMYLHVIYCLLFM